MLQAWRQCSTVCIASFWAAASTREASFLGTFTASLEVSVAENQQLKQQFFFINIFTETCSANNAAVTRKCCLSIKNLRRKLWFGI